MKGDNRIIKIPLYLILLLAGGLIGTCLTTMLFTFKKPVPRVKEHIVHDSLSSSIDSIYGYTTSDSMDSFIGSEYNPEFDKEDNLRFSPYNHMDIILLCDPPKKRKVYSEKNSKYIKKEHQP